jgi:catechol 2,3-dioxygenase-like lactoylglutathione lyase family enzyme
MKIKRVVANIETSDIDKADTFYHDVLGYERIAQTQRCLFRSVLPQKEDLEHQFRLCLSKSTTLKPPWQESKMQAFQSSMVQKGSLGEYEDSLSEIHSES